MKIDIYRNFELIDRIYSVERLEVAKHWCGVGRFSLVMHENPNLKVDDLLIVKDHVLIVEDIFVYRDLKNIAKYNVKGCDLNGLLNRRVLTEKYVATIGASIESEIRNHVKIACIDAGARKIDRFYLGATLGVPNTVAEQKEYDQMRLSQLIEEMLSGSKIGYRILFEPNSKQFQFALTRGADKSSEVAFSERFHNLANAEVNLFGSEEINVAYHNGEVKGDAQGFRRREGYSEKVIPPQTAVLGNILSTEQYIFGEDWNLGDFVTVEDPRIQLKTKKQILEIREYFGRNYEMEVFFGGE